MPVRLRTKGNKVEVLLEAHGRSSKQREPPRKPARKKLWRGEAFGLRSDSTSSSITRDPLFYMSLSFYSFKKGAVFLITFLPTESNYLGSPLYLILCYIQKGVCTREESVPTRYAPVALGDGFLHDKGTACAMESQADTNTQSSHPKVDEQGAEGLHPEHHHAVLGAHPHQGMSDGR